MSKQYDSAPELTIDLAKSYRATLHTNKGDIEIEFQPERSPQTVNNFVFLARDGFYDGGHLPPGHLGLHGPGRRSDRDRTGRSRLPVP